MDWTVYLNLSFLCEPSFIETPRVLSIELPNET
jgi:hypothetical protein